MVDKRSIPNKEDDFAEAPLIVHIPFGNGPAAKPTKEGITPSFWRFSTLPERMAPALGGHKMVAAMFVVNLLSLWFLWILNETCHCSYVCYYARTLAPIFFVTSLCLWFLAIPMYFFSLCYYYKHGAIAYANTAKRWYRRFGMPSVKVELMLAHYHETRGEYDAAIACYESILEGHPSLHDKKGGVCIYKSLGIACYLAHRYEEASEYMQTTVRLRTLKDTKARPSQCQHDFQWLGNTYKALGKNTEALEAYQKTVQIIQDAGNGKTVDMANSIVKVGIVHETMGSLEDAILVYREALEILLQNEGNFPRTEAVAKLHDKLGDLIIANDQEAAMDHWNSAIKVYRRTGKKHQAQKIVLLETKLRDARSDV